MAEFGLRNALLLVGDQFLEVAVADPRGTTVQRLLDKRDGAGGYMAIFEVDDLDERVDHLAATVFEWCGLVTCPTSVAVISIRADVGGDLVSIDQPVPNGQLALGRPGLAGPIRASCWPTRR